MTKPSPEDLEKAREFMRSAHADICDSCNEAPCARYTIKLHQFAQALASEREAAYRRAAEVPKQFYERLKKAARKHHVGDGDEGRMDAFHECMMQILALIDKGDKP